MQSHCLHRSGRITPDGTSHQNRMEETRKNNGPKQTAGHMWLIRNRMWCIISVSFEEKAESYDRSRLCLLTNGEFQNEINNLLLLVITEPRGILGLVLFGWKSMRRHWMRNGNWVLAFPMDWSHDKWPELPVELACFSSSLFSKACDLLRVSGVSWVQVLRQRGRHICIKSKGSTLIALSCRYVPLIISSID